MNGSTLIEGTYQIIRPIGSGSGGEVYLAYHTRLEKNVVLKKIKLSAQKMLDIRAEADILKNLHHPYLPQVFDFIMVTDDNGEQSIYTVMDFIPGRSFEDLMIGGARFTPTQVAKYTHQLCEAVEYLHSRTPPILHGDIKPANVMLTPDDNICLIDFNISGSSDDFEVVAFTRGYASPEQCEAARENRLRRKQIAAALSSAQPYNGPLSQPYNGQVYRGGDATELDDDATELDDDRTELDNDPVVDAVLRGEMHTPAGVTFAPVARIDRRSDIFSIGATAYCLLTGHKPDPDYDRQIPVSKLGMNVSDGLAYIIDKAMMKKPGDRFQSASEMLRAMDSLGKKDKRYKRLVVREVIFCTIFILLASLSSITAYRGYGMMQSERADTYYSRALELYEAREYEDGLRYIIAEALSDESIYDDGTLGSLYYLAAECNFELGEYESALSFYEQAIEHDPTDADYYCNYAISLSRMGRVDRASAAIDEAVMLGLSDDKVSLMRGELAAARGMTDEAEAAFRSCIDSSDDAYLLARAYMMYSDLYASDPAYDGSEELISKNIAILEEAENSVDDAYLPIILERLADAYGGMASLTDDRSYLESTVGVCKRLIELNWGTYNNYMNLAAAYDKLGDFEQCRSTYEEVLEAFGENYAVYKDLAFMELEVQASKDPDARDYGKFKEYYDSAVSLYEASGGQQDADTEMQLLNESYSAVVNGGWLK